MSAVEIEYRLVAFRRTFSVEAVRVLKAEFRMHQEPRQRNRCDRKGDVRDAAALINRRALTVVVFGSVLIAATKAPPLWPRSSSTPY